MQFPSSPSAGSCFAFVQGTYGARLFNAQTSFASPSGRGVPGSLCTGRTETLHSRINALSNSFLLCEMFTGIRGECSPTQLPQESRPFLQLFFPFVFQQLRSPGRASSSESGLQLLRPSNKDGHQGHFQATCSGTAGCCPPGTRPTNGHLVNWRMDPLFHAPNT